MGKNAQVCSLHSVADRLDISKSHPITWFFGPLTPSLLAPYRNPWCNLLLFFPSFSLALVCKNFPIREYVSSCSSISLSYTWLRAHSCIRQYWKPDSIRILRLSVLYKKSEREIQFKDGAISSLLIYYIYNIIILIQ